MNVSDSDIIPETQIVSETQEETQEERRNAPVKKLLRNPARKQLWPDKNFKRRANLILV